MLLASPFNTVAQGNIIITQMRFEPVISYRGAALEIDGALFVL
jgi:hypothetical protein